MLGALETALTAPPPRLTALERRVVVILTLAVGVSRWVAEARSMWDWDEALFSMAVRDYDVAQHHPHPPGFPIFIAVAKLLRLVGLSEFHSLQAVVFIGALFVFPAMFFLARELRISFPTSVISALLLAFLPNVWFFGGTGFSDVPSMTLSLVAIALLLGGCRSLRSYLLGAVVLGIAAGFRPQNLLIGFVPAILATLIQAKRSLWRPLAAVALGTMVVVMSFAMAARASGGWMRYSETLKAHQHYIASVDSFRNPNRPPLSILALDFFVRPFRMRAINWAMAFLASIAIAAAVAGRRWNVGLALSTFLPFCLFAWLMLDHFSVSRFSIAYMPLFAILAAIGIEVATPSRLTESVVGAIAAAGLVVAAFPAVRLAHDQVSPPYAAIEWIRHNVSPQRAVLYVHDSMGPYVETFLPEYKREVVEESEKRLPTAQKEGFYVTEGVVRGGRVFSRSRTLLARIVRDRYFETSVVPVSALVAYSEGWYDPEASGNASWRWMGRRSVSLLNAPFAPLAELKLRCYVPLDALNSHPTLRIVLNGVLLDQFQAVRPTLARTYRVSPRRDAPNELIIETSKIVNPAAAGITNDARDLGVRLDDIEWRPVQQ